MRLVLLLLLLLLQVKAFAQKEATNWYFGNNVGLSFSNGHPVALTDGAMLAHEGCAVMSDSETGELLFYTNGVQVWNREHRVMPNGSGLLSDLSSTQAALIVPFPGHPQQFYLFAVNSTAHFITNHVPGLTYSIVNMELDGGLGDIAPPIKNTRLLSLTSENLTAVPHANGQGYWIITHGVGNNEFYVFLLSEEGIMEQKTEKVGLVHRAGDGKLDGGDVAGYLKASPDGRKLASAIWADSSPAPIELFDFDAATGTISNAVSLGFADLPIHYGVSFSPDNSKLYVSGVAVYQFDLSLPSTQDIINSQVQITTTPASGPLGSVQSLQLGPDGKLYNNVNMGAFNTFYVINYPNRAGMACQPERVEFDFNGRSAEVGLPNFIQSYFNGLEPIEGEQQECKPIVTLYPNPTTGAVRFTKEGDCGDAKTFSLRIANSIGQVVAREMSGLTLENEVDISGYAEGLYLFTLTFPDSQQVVEKVVKVN